MYGRDYLEPSDHLEDAPHPRALPEHYELDLTPSEHYQFTEDSKVFELRMKSGGTITIDLVSGSRHLKFGGPTTIYFDAPILFVGERTIEHVTVATDPGPN